MRTTLSLLTLCSFLWISIPAVAIDNKLISSAIGDEKEMASARKAASMLIMVYPSYKMGKYAKKEMDRDIKRFITIWDPKEMWTGIDPNLFEPTDRRISRTYSCLSGLALGRMPKDISDCILMAAISPTEACPSFKVTSWNPTRPLPNFVSDKTAFLNYVAFEIMYDYNPLGVGGCESLQDSRFVDAMSLIGGAPEKAVREAYKDFSLFEQK